MGFDTSEKYRTGLAGLSGHGAGIIRYRELLLGFTVLVMWYFAAMQSTSASVG